MRTGIHPKYFQVNVICACGNTFMCGTTTNKDIHLEICSACHPYYTGKQKLMDTAGRVDRFRKKYEKNAPVAEKATPAA